MNQVKYPLLSLLLAIIPLAFFSCSDEPEAETPLDVDFEVPASMVVSKNADCVFAVKDGKSPLISDLVMMENASGISYEGVLSSVSPERFSVRFPTHMGSGEYRVYLKRGERKKSFGKSDITVVERIISPEEGATVYGFISDSEGEGVAGVQVSDGFEIVTTDADGVYQMNSKKELGYVFYTVPSGYEPQTKGVMPQIFQQTKLGASVSERIDFVVDRVGNQDDYKVVFLGDMHLADRTNDINQFTNITDDINKYRGAHPSDRIYGITLGDMTWDIYWYTRKFSMDEYVATVNSRLSGMTIYHTIGNHDNDYKATNNIDAKFSYRSVISPNYYSFNIGQVHYVVLDNIDCSSYDGTESRNYVEQVVPEQLAWLSRDLEYVDKGTPVVIMMHAPLYYPLTATRFKKDLVNADQLLGVVDGYDVQFVTGHTHKNYNVLSSDDIVGGAKVQEHNVGAVCGDWWWSGYLTPGCLMAPDGTPAGYAVWDFKGKKFSYRYKGCGLDESVQFRSYDLNNVKFSMSDVPELPATSTSAVLSFQRYCVAYPGTQNNEVLLNVWNYNADWTISVVTDKGQSLTVTPVMAYDPLHIAAMSVKRFNSSSVTSAPNFITQNFNHFFKVKAPDADTDLIITVTDEFGNVSVENMARPKPFDIESYRW
ncbi:MAG: calcineurin-like phosphoesterase family protein [Paramuribaculum sp.]|nr:calcineurin-like phosphoesterase family protein [Paramuribaculum sp.]